MIYRAIRTMLKKEKNKKQKKRLHRSILEALYRLQACITLYYLLLKIFLKLMRKLIQKHRIDTHNLITAKKTIKCNT